MDAASYDRAQAKIRYDADGCWTWTGALTKVTRPGAGGYALGRIDGKTSLVHRAMYLHLVGPINEGMKLDHLCRNRACINPEHLEPVPNRTNILRGVGFTAVNAAKTHCPKGHPYSGANLFVDKSGRRHCRECRRDRSRAWFAANPDYQRPR